MQETPEDLVFEESSYRAMVEHAIVGLPNEACGVLSGPIGERKVDGFHPMTNVAASREVYLLDGQELLEVERSADRSGRSILGVMHSHTHTEAYPSATDIEEANRSDPFGIWFFTIVTLKDPEPVARAFRIVERDVIEVRVAIESG